MELGRSLEIIVDDYTGKLYKSSKEDCRVFLFGFDVGKKSEILESLGLEGYRTKTVKNPFEDKSKKHPLIILVNSSDDYSRKRVINAFKDKYKARDLQVVSVDEDAGTAAIMKSVDEAREEIKLEMIKRELAKSIADKKLSFDKNHGQAQTEREEDWKEASVRLEEKLEYNIVICDVNTTSAKHIAEGLREIDYSNIDIVRLLHKDDKEQLSGKERANMHYKNMTVVKEEVLKRAKPNTIYLLRAPKVDEVLDFIILNELMQDVRKQYLEEEFQVVLIADDTDFGKFSSLGIGLSPHAVRLAEDSDIKKSAQTAVIQTADYMKKTRDAHEYHRQKPDILFNEMVHHILDRNDFDGAEKIAEEGLDTITETIRQVELEIRRMNEKSLPGELDAMLSNLVMKRRRFRKWLGLIKGDESQVPVYRISTDQVYVLDEKFGAEKLCVKVYDNSSRYCAEYKMLEFLDNYNSEIKFKLINKPDNFKVENPYLPINTKTIKLEKSLKGLQPKKEGKFSLLIDWISGPTMYELGKSLIRRTKSKAVEFKRSVNFRVNKYLAILQREHAEIDEAFEKETDFSENLHRSFYENLEYSKVDIPEKGRQCLNYCIGLFGSFIKHKPATMYLDVNWTNILINTGDDTSTLDDILDSVDERGIRQFVDDNLFKIDFNKAHRLTSAVEDRRHDYRGLKAEDAERELLGWHYLLYAKKLELWDGLEHGDEKRLIKRFAPKVRALKSVDKYIRWIEEGRTQKDPKKYRETVNWMKKNMCEEYDRFYDDEPFITLYRVLRWRDHFLTKYLMQSTKQIQTVGLEVMKNVRERV